MEIREREGGIKRTTSRAHWRTANALGALGGLHTPATEGDKSSTEAAIPLAKGARVVCLPCSPLVS